MFPLNPRFLRFSALLAALAAAVWLAAPPPPPLRSGEAPLLPRPGLLKGLFAGQVQLVADYYWIITINRVANAKTVEDSRDIFYYADLVSELDPKFRHIYPFAGISIPVKQGRTYANANLSTRLLRKGAKHLPEDYRTLFLLGYNLIFFHERYREAAEVFKSVQSHPLAPPWLPRLTSRLYAHSGDLEASEALTLQLLESAEDEDSKRAYELRLKEIAQERILRELDAAAAKFVEAQGRRPSNFNDLVQGGYVSSDLKDPLGGWFVFGKDGRARSTASRFRLEVIPMDEDKRPEPLNNGSPE